MKVSIWVTNLEDKHFQYTNSVKTILETGKVFAGRGYCEENDLLIYDATARPFKETTIKIVHKAKNPSEAEYIKLTIQERLNEKMHLRKQIQALKKIEDNEIQLLIDKLKKDLHDNYFEVNISKILEGYK